MPRPPKNKAVPEPVVPAAAPVTVPVAAPAAALNMSMMNMRAPGGGPVIDPDQFLRVRDSVYQRLLTIQDLMRSFSQDFLRQTNLLIGESTNLDDGAELERMAGHLTNMANMIPAAFVPPQPPVEEKKERKKRTHDPNAPKRPLTPYFLYMQTARPIIANDLGDQVPKGAVQDEGQRRWSVMSPAEKLGWNQAYQYNLRLYNARVHSYKHGNPDAKNMTDDEARAYADQHGIGLPPLTQVAEAAPAADEEAIAEQLQQSAAAEPSPPSEASEEEPAAPVAKTPKKKETRKRKSTAAAATPAPAAAEPEPAKSAAATPASPEAKKRKRVSKAVEQVVEEPKKSGRKKTKA
ncbi:uncharacterized protein B0T15DRAFT_38937 [Chaetomium strumarium]|uniref:HMG box domain-containing protein n=1 Tax=Chaetomium strumarium TaxID=1170767 RepID=A0AAJ0H257_9PEZI|nr:hypothetical protein B0T15DRAFT_38937 [Chaetomium strumarium]